MIAAEQKARTTYDNILRLIKDPEICEPIRFLRQRELVHYQRFGEANLANLSRFCGQHYGQTLGIIAQVIAGYPAGFYDFALICIPDFVEVFGHDF